jgi:hypothetical protein
MTFGASVLKEVVGNLDFFLSSFSLQNTADTTLCHRFGMI